MSASPFAADPPVGGPDADPAVPTVTHAQVYAAGLELALIDESPRNPRRRYDLAAQADLEASVRVAGVITPVLVRPVDGGRYELAAGHRRCRAARAVGLATVPALIRVMSDAELREVLAIENLQRADVHPLDEGQALREMVDTGWTVAGLAARLGKSESYVRRRLALAALVEPWPAAYDGGEIRLEALEAVARLAPDQQVQLAKAMTRDHRPALMAWLRAVEPAHPTLTEWGPDEDDDAIDAHDPGERAGRLFEAAAARAPSPVTLDGVRQWTADRTLDLAVAPWDLLDWDLVPAAGSCHACVKRTGAQAALWPEVEDGDLCLDRACWAKKAEALVALRRREVEEETGTVPAVVSDQAWGRGLPEVRTLGEVVEPGTPGATPVVVAEGARMGQVLHVLPHAPTPAAPPRPQAAADDRAAGKAAAEARYATALQELRRLAAVAARVGLEPTVQALAPVLVRAACDEMFGGLHGLHAALAESLGTDDEDLYEWQIAERLASDTGGELASRLLLLLGAVLIEDVRARYYTGPAIPVQLAAVGEALQAAGRRKGAAAAKAPPKPAGAKRTLREVRAAKQTKTKKR